MPTAIVRYHEIALKGGNRSFFESRLRINIQHVFQGVQGIKVPKFHDHFKVEFDREEDKPLIEEGLKNIFGVANFSFLESVEPDMEKVATRAVELLRELVEEEKSDESIKFRIKVKRGDKKFQLISTEIAKELSLRVLPQFNCFQVELKNPEVILYVDWGVDEVRLYVSKIEGVGGLPVGTGGKVCSLISSGFDSPVASWMMMKRGAKVVYVHFHSYPATGEESIENVREIVKQLNKYQYHSKLYLIPLIDFQKVVLAKAPAPLRVLLYRRMMIRLAERVARYEEAKALVTGESLGQVASQTLDNMGVVDALATKLVLRPLIGMNKKEIIQMAGRIGTEEISSQPYDDCCSLYVPRAPALAAKLYEIEDAEKELEIEKYEELLWAKRELEVFK
jgi:tRNA uracil 4-sulfurtransferase